MHGIFGGDACLLMDQSAAESDERFKQLVVYVLLEHRGRFVHYSRRALDDDARLRGRSSIGFGGHIDGEDVGDPPRGLTIEEAVDLLVSVGEREVHEEVLVEGGYETSFLGVVNDDRDAVGRVHFGFVVLWRLREARVAAREPGIDDVRFLTLEELRDVDRPLESWTRLCLDHVRPFDVGDRSAGDQP